MQIKKMKAFLASCVFRERKGLAWGKGVLGHFNKVEWDRS